MARMGKIMKTACLACPYRKDVPSGVWAEEEYDKLSLYDAPTAAQPFNPFACHAQPENYCHGWAVVHTSRGHEFDLIALRIVNAGPIPAPSTELFSSGAEAAAHGKKDINRPGRASREIVRRLLAKHDRLRGE